MSDDPLRSFYARAAATLSAAYEYLKALDYHDKQKFESGLLLLEGELKSWEGDIATGANYEISYYDARAQHGVWLHTGQVGPEPSLPDWPSYLPPFVDSRLVFSHIKALTFFTSQLRDVFQNSLPEDSYNTDVLSMMDNLASLGPTLTRMKERIERRAEPVANHQQDTTRKIRQQQPDNVDVRDLCKLLEKNRSAIEAGEKTDIGVAREHTRETVANCPKAKNLLRQARRYPHLWKQR